MSLETGCVERPADAGACVRTYATRVDAGVVLVELPGRLERETWQPAATADEETATVGRDVSEVSLDASS